MLKHYNDTLDQVRTAEASLIEISSLQQQIAGNLALQSENVDMLVQDSLTTEGNVQQGNKQLKQASEKRSWAQLVFYSTCGLCTFVSLVTRRECFRLLTY